MAFYDGLAGKLQKTGQDALEKTKKTTEVMKLKSEISDLEKTNHSLYTNIGKTYFTKYMNSVPDDEMTSFFQNIKDNIKRIEALQNQILNLKGLTICKNCGGEISPDAAFCKHCGANLLPGATVGQNEKKCPNCGKPVSNDSLFCTSCGQSLATVDGQEATKEEKMETDQQPAENDNIGFSDIIIDEDDSMNMFTSGK